ncbi:MAG: 50S ribosomal protein L30 [Alistipes sp.]|nr:50S ribosomal protein L30 [Alistipes sp.]
MATLKITQIKSRIGATAQQCKNLDALGLRKINQSVEHSDSAIILGMITRVKHLVKVETVEVAEKKAAKKAAPAVEAPVVEAAAEETAEKKPAKKAPAKKEAAEKKPAAKKVTKTKKEE